MLKKRTHILFLFCLIALSAQSVTSSYYSNASGKSDASLRDALYNITKVGPSGMSYAGLWTAYKTTDVYPTGHANAGKIWDMYGDCVFTYSTDQCGSYSNICDCYNREHSLPKSWFNDATPMYYDLGHIVPTDGKVNGYRSNYPFGEVSSGSTYQGGSKLGTAKSITVSNTIVNTSGSTTQSCSASKVFEPVDEYKGDFARMYMYMRVRYYNTNFTQDSENYGQYHFTTTYTKAGYYGLTAYSVALLMKWHRQDPVSQKEIDRNNAMETAQGNRNPFIDYPCLAEYLWGEHTGETFSTSTSVGSFESGFTPGTSTGCSSSSTPTTNYTLTWKVNGSTAATTTSSGSSVGSLPSTPANCSTSRVFVGWTTSSSVSSKPSVLFTSASDAPSISANTTFYAVYADKTTGSSASATFSASDISATPLSGTLAWTHTASGITLTLSAGQRYTSGTPNTFTVTKGTSNYAQLSGDKTITQVVATISGTNYKINSVSPGSLSTSSTTQTITGINSTSVTMYATSNYQIRLTQLVVTYTSVSYSNYSLTCSSSTSCTQAPTLNAATTSNVTTNSATASCTGITSLGSSGCTISAYGFVYGTSSNPTLASGTVVLLGNSYTSTGTAFSTSLTGLNSGTTYYVRPYATNGYGTGYGSQASFTTKTLTSYTVTWKVNGSTYTTGNPTTSVTEGGQVSTLPTAPSAPTACSDKVFVGWSTTNIGTTATNTAPSVLFTTASASPTINQATTFYAVFADAGSGSSGTASFTPSDFSGQGTANTGSAISATKNGVTFACNKGYGYGTTQIRCYSGGTVTISSSNTITTLAFTFSGTTYQGGLSTSYSGLSTTNWTQTLSSQARFTAITVTYGGGTSYSNYVTQCAAPVTYTITYNAGTYGSGTVASTTKTAGVAATLSSSTFTRTGYTQTAWASDAAGTTYAYALGGSYTTDADITLYPYWTALPTYTVTFKNGTTTYDTKTGYEGQTISVSTPTACDGYTFVGWSTHQYGSSNTGTPTIDYTGTIPSGNTTYYAVFSYQGNATTSLTNNYERITALSDLTSGNYLVVGYYNSNYYAMNTTVTGNYYLSQTNVTSTSNIISNPAASIIWNVTVNGSTVTFYNANVGKYVYTYNSNRLGLTTGTTGNAYTASVSSGVWTFVSTTYTSYRIRYRGSYSRFESYTSASNSIYLYKQKEETTYTTYYTTSTQLTVSVESADTSMGTVSVQTL